MTKLELLDLRINGMIEAARFLGQCGKLTEMRGFNYIRALEDVKNLLYSPEFGIMDDRW